MNPAASPLGGIALVIGAVACFATLDTTTKYISASVPVLMALWFRYFFQAASTTVALLPRRGRNLLRTQHPRFHALRGVLLLLTSLFAFYSVKYMPVGEFTAIVMITPLVVTLLAATQLGEKVSALRWVLVAGGFIGTLIIIRPERDDFNLTMLLPLGLVACNAWFQVLTSRLARTEDPMTMHFYTGWVGALVATAILPLVWQTIPDTHTFALLCLVGLMGTVGHFLLILAFARAPASTLTPYLYTQIGFAMLCGWLVFNHIPGRLELTGIVLIVVCGATASWITAREHRLPMEPPEA